MELRHLRYFIAVTEAQSFTRAAEKLFIAQPPLSKQIKDLEEELGVILFERGSRPLRTTPAGYFLYQHALKVLANIEEIKSMTNRIGSIQRNLLFGFDESLLFGLLPKIVYSYRQSKPHLNIQLIAANAMEQVQALKEGHLDVGVVRVRIPDPAIKHVFLREERLVVAVHQNHPLAQSTEGVHLAELIDEKIFIYPNTPKPNFATHVINIFAEYNLTLNNVQEVRDIQLSMGLVAAGEGIGIIPISVNAIHFQELKFLPILDKEAVSPIFIIMRSMDQNEDLLSLFDCTYKVYDTEGISYKRVNLSPEEN